MPLTPYSVSNGSFPMNSKSFTFAALVINNVTPIATSIISTHRPMPAAAVSVIGTNPPLLNPARNIRHTGEITQRNVASASFGAVSRLSARYRDASSMLTRRSAGVLSAAAGSSAGSSISSLSR